MPGENKQTQSEFAQLVRLSPSTKAVISASGVLLVRGSSAFILSRPEADRLGRALS